MRRASWRTRSMSPAIAATATRDASGPRKRAVASDTSVNQRRQRGPTMPSLPGSWARWIISAYRPIMRSSRAGSAASRLSGTLSSGSPCRITLTPPACSCPIWRSSAVTVLPSGSSRVTPPPLAITPEPMAASRVDLPVPVAPCTTTCRGIPVWRSSAAGVQVPSAVRARPSRTGAAVRRGRGSSGRTATDACSLRMPGNGAPPAAGRRSMACATLAGTACPARSEG